MTARTMRASATYQNRILTAVKYIVAIAFALIVLIPLFATLVNGFKSNAEVLLHPFALPTIWHWENYIGILQSTAFWRQLGNSTGVMLATSFGVVALSSMPAFVFARMTFRGRELL